MFPPPKGPYPNSDDYCDPSDPYGKNARRLERPPHRAKQIYAMKRNVEKAEQIYGKERFGFLTLNFSAQVSTREAQECFKRARRFLKKLFQTYLGVIESSKSGRVHIHLIVVCRENILSGFDFSCYDQIRALETNPYKLPILPDWKSRKQALSRKLSTNDALKALWRKLREQLPAYGFGKKVPFHLCPIRRSLTAAIIYMTKSLHQPASSFPMHTKGTRLFVREESFPNDHRSNFSWVTGDARQFRKDQQCICDSLGIDRENLIVLLGKRSWAKRFMQLLQGLERTSPGWFCEPQENREKLILTVLVSIIDQMPLDDRARARERLPRRVIPPPPST